MLDYLSEFLRYAGRNSRNNNTYKAAQLLQQKSYSMIFNQLCSEFCARFNWTCDNPEAAVEVGLIEKTILFSGACAFAKIREKNGSYSRETWRNCRVAALNNQSFYGLPNSCQLTDYVGRNLGTFIPVQKEDPTDIANCVLIYDNLQAHDPMAKVMYYTDQLGTIQDRINSAIRGITGTTVVTCPEEQGKQIEKALKAADTGLPVIVSYKEAYAEELPDPKLLMAPGCPEVLEALHETFNKVHNDFLQSIGVRVNNEVGRKSGITPIEIVENRQNVDLILNQDLRARKDGIEMAKRIGLTGLAVDLDNFESLVSDFDSQGNRIQNVDPEASQINQKEGEEHDPE